MDENEIKELVEIYSKKYLPYKEVNGDYVCTLDEFEHMLKICEIFIKKKPVIGKHLEGLPVRISDYYTCSYKLATNIGIIKKIFGSTIEVLVKKENGNKSILAFDKDDLEILVGGI